MSASIKTRAALIVRYAIAGFIGACIQTGTLYVWVSIFHYTKTYLMGAVIGFCLALFFTFLLQKYWTFRDHTSHRTRSQVFWYSAVALINVTVNITLLAGAKLLLSELGLDFFGGWYLLVQIFVVVIASGISFILNFFFTFRNQPERVAESLESPPLV